MTDKTTNFLVENYRLIVAGVIAALVIGIGAAIFIETNNKKEVAASAALFEARVAVTELKKEKKITQAAEKYLAVAQKYVRTYAGFEALLAAADLLVENKSYPDAIKNYDAAATRAPDNFSKLLALYSKGIAQENSGAQQDALKSYEVAIATSNSDYLKPELLMAEARCYESLKDFKKAGEIYKSVQDKYPTKSYYSSAAAAFYTQLQAQQK